MPYPALLIPLTTFFSIPGNQQFRYNDEQRQVLLRWFWRTCFSRRYNSQPVKSLKADIKEVVSLKLKKSTKLDEIPVSVEPDFFKENIFRINTVITKTFVLLLAQQQPYSLISGSPITMSETLKDYNRNEFHHLYPRAYLKQTAQTAYDNSCLSNFCFLSRADNNKLGGVAQSTYRAHMPASVNEILAHACCPNSLFDGNFKDFIDERSEILSTEPNKRLGN